MFILVYSLIFEIFFSCPLLYEKQNQTIKKKKNLIVIGELVLRTHCPWTRPFVPSIQWSSPCFFSPNAEQPQEPIELNCPKSLKPSRSKANFHRIKHPLPHQSPDTCSLWHQPR
ncbi:unnamed protein product, partial [Vitis vinifera]|uniref:Uncharacterized protein n=1 Tax=Vitis vinifera TaxID=29760 RepID=D7TSX3_VITVI